MCRKEYLEWICQTYGVEVRDYLLNHYREKGIEDKTEDRARYLKEVMGFEMEEGLSVESFVQVSEICGILAPQYPHLFALGTIDSGLN